MLTQSCKRRYAGDLLIIVLLLAVCATALVITLPDKNTENLSADVFLDGKLVTSLALDTDTVFSPDNGHTVITVKNGRAFISDSDCPDGICLQMEGVYATSQNTGAVCVPNKVSLAPSESKNTKAFGSPDAVVG